MFAYIIVSTRFKSNTKIKVSYDCNSVDTRYDAVESVDTRLS